MRPVPRLPAPAAFQRDWPVRFSLLALLLTATFVAYYPAWHGGLLWDDEAHITRSELRSAAGLWRIWSDVGATQQYYPLTHSVFWVLYRFFGDVTFPYHAVNIALHASSAFLLALALQRLWVPGAWLAAALFALHPVHVESVAWITELKNTLSGVFYLGSALAYLRFDDRREGRYYALALTLFVMALLSKSVTATLPAALLVVFWWRRGQLRWRADVRPLVPLFVIGAAAGFTTAWVEETLIGARGAQFELTVIERCLVAGRAIWFYLGTLVWPAHLTFVYPRWRIDPQDLTQFLYPLGVIALLAALWVLRGRARAPVAALLIFCVTLFPALGFLNVYPFRYSFVADHFQYLASISILTLIAAVISFALARYTSNQRTMAAALVCISVPLAAITYQQSGQYADAETLYRATIRRNPAATMAYINLGLMYLQRPADAWPQAVALLQKAVAVDPVNAEAHLNLGGALQKVGRVAEATQAYRTALELDPNQAAAYNNLGAALEHLGRHDEAAVQYAEAIRLSSDTGEAHANLGRLLLGIGRSDEAAGHLVEALRHDPANSSVHYLLGTAFAEMGRIQDAVVEYRVALEDRSLAATPELHNDLGVALAKLGQLEEAAAHFREALRIEPGFEAARANLQMTAAPAP